ncbi:MAG: response regulator transcription factor [Sulfurimonas sp.]
MNKEITLLYAEDEMSIRKSYVRYIRHKYSFKVDEAFDGLEALELYKIHQYDIIITDLTMPNMDGLELIEKIREISYSTKIIVLTAHSEQEKMLAALDLLIVNYLIKPISRKKLCDVIDVALKILSIKGDKENILHLEENTKWHLETCELYTNNEEVKLTKRESLLLEILCLNINIKISTTDIFLHIWYEDFDKEYNPDSVRTLVKKLRKKLPQNILENIYGGFYRLNTQISL